MAPPRGKAFLDGLAAAIAGMTAEDQAAIRGLAEESRQWQQQAEHYQRTAHDLAGELAAARETITTQADALASIERALRAWEGSLGTS